MSRNPRYDILFEPIKIGPVTAPNRFYCTPHALGTGQQMPHTRAAMRGMRAEGGWGVINTGYCSIHPSSDDAPLPYCRLWDDEDIKVHALMVDAVHHHGSLAGVELWHGGDGTGNRLTRVPLMSASGISTGSTYPGWMNLAQSRYMDKDDIREFRQWHIDAAIRARSAGFDVVYIYAGMNFGPYQFLLPWLNNRTDEYGGSLGNRVRLMREIIEDMKDAVGESCAVALRFSTDELLQVPSNEFESEAHEVISLLSEVPDLWDVKAASWVVEASSARFTEQGAREPFTSFVKPLTNKPVVSTGRFTSPDEMVRQIKRGIIDLIGAARPSIADPFLPKKIDEGREDEIRECIGCNICVSGYHDCVPVRCTQNPTMGEEWRRGWHPENVPTGDASTSVLVVGAGPAGLECAKTLGDRGFAVTLAESSKELGGRVSKESKLPGLATWARVRDYRTNLIQTMGNIDIYKDSMLSAADITELGCDHVVIATGAKWTRNIPDEQGRPGKLLSGNNIYTPDDILAGVIPESPVIIFDFDHYYMGSCLAELLTMQDLGVTYVTPANSVSAWSFMNNELTEIRQRMMDLGVTINIDHNLTEFDNGSAQLTSVFRDDDTKTVEAGSVVIVGKRQPNDSLFKDLISDTEALANTNTMSVKTIGDCRVPGAIVHAVYSGHECARTIDDESEVPIKWERPKIFS